MGARTVIPTLEVETVTFTSGYKEALQYLAAVKGYSRSSIDNYERSCMQFLAYLRSRGLEDAVKNFNGDTVLGFATDLGQRGVHPNTVLNKLWGLSTVARFLMKRKDGRGRPLLAENPTRTFERPQAVQTETKFLHPDELQRFLAIEAPVHLDLARELLMDTGLRCSEALGANVGHLREVNGVTYLAIPVKGRRRQNEAPAEVPLSAECAAKIRASLLDRGWPELAQDAPLLVDSQGERWRRGQLTCAMVRLGAAAGISRLTTSPHKLRHTGNVIARIEGIDPVRRARMLNHRSLRTLARYDHLVPGETAQAREQQRQGLAKYISSSAPAAPALLAEAR